MFIFGGLLSIIQVYRAKAMFFCAFGALEAFFLRLNSISYHRGKNMRSKRLFETRSAAALLFYNFAHVFVFDASPSFCILFFFVFFVFVFSFLFFLSSLCYYFLLLT